jgi:hypothetical protein
MLSGATVGTELAPLMTVTKCGRRLNDRNASKGISLRQSAINFLFHA